MHCDVCHKLPGTIHILDLVDGALTEEKKLCPSCAESAGFVHPKSAPLKITPEMLEDLLGSMQSGGNPKSETVEPSKDPDLSCPACGLSASQFRSRGRLGCPRCYDVFRKALIPLLERVHDATSHKGRCPGKPARMAGAGDKLADLRQSLRDAIDAENYELAASLRDQIQTLTGRQVDEEPTP